MQSKRPPCQRCQVLEANLWDEEFYHQITQSRLESAIELLSEIMNKCPEVVEKVPQAHPDSPTIYFIEDVFGQY